MSRLNEIEFQARLRGKEPTPARSVYRRSAADRIWRIPEIKAQQALNADADGAQVVDRARTKSDGGISKSEDATNTSYKEGEFS